MASSMSPISGTAHCALHRSKRAGAFQPGPFQRVERAWFFVTGGDGPTLARIKHRKVIAGSDLSWDQPK